MLEVEESDLSHDDLEGRYKVNLQTIAFYHRENQDPISNFETLMNIPCQNFTPTPSWVALWNLNSNLVIPEEIENLMRFYDKILFVAWAEPFKR